jgi:antitoxin CptB
MSEESVDARRRKLIFRADHRGFKEMDLFMGEFARTHVPAMSEAQLEEFEAILNMEDQEVYSWITRQERPSEAARSGTLDLVLSFRYSGADNI